MKHKLLLIFFLLSFSLNAQTRTITGKVIAEDDLTIIPGIDIRSIDTVVLGKTDINGNFKVELPVGMDRLMLTGIGWDWTIIEIQKNCDKLEIIIMIDTTYDFLSKRRINKHWEERFKDRKNKHHQAHEKGIFTSDTPCITYIFKKH